MRYLSKVCSTGCQTLSSYVGSSVCRIKAPIQCRYYLFSSAEDRTPRPGEKLPSWPKPQPNQPMLYHRIPRPSIPLDLCRGRGSLSMISTMIDLPHRPRILFSVPPLHLPRRLVQEPHIRMERSSQFQLIQHRINHKNF